MTGHAEGFFSKRGIWSAVTSAVFLGCAPIFGKLAISSGFSPLATVLLRTSLASLLLLLIVCIFNRKYLFIYPAGLLGCILAGSINGLGSVMYYFALSRLNAGTGQLIFSLYPIIMALWLLLDNYKLSRITYLRILFALIGIILLTSSTAEWVNPIGIICMLGAAFMYAVHIPINQRVLMDVPPPTVTLYTLLSMTVVVIPAYLIFDRSIPSIHLNWFPIMGLTLVTFFSRILLFTGVKHLGSMQTSILGLCELLITIGLSYYWLHETLNRSQWFGALLLVLSILLISAERPIDLKARGRFWHWIHPPDISSNLPWQPHN